METKEVKINFTPDIVSSIAKFFADKYQEPQMAFQLVSNENCGSTCDCSCGGPSDSCL